MKRFFAGMFIALLLAAPAFSSAKAGAKAEEDAVVNASVIKAEKSGPEENNKFLFFAEYNIGYAAAAGPKELSDNDTGVYDTPRFGAGAGLSIFMVDLYASASFLFFADRQDTSQHYTFIPLAAGVRINIVPEMGIYPDVFFEYGRSVSNRHVRYTDEMTMQVVEFDEPWTGEYYNFGLGINWKFTDITVLSLRLERPAVTGKDNREYHVFSAGLAWKLVY